MQENPSVSGRTVDIEFGGQEVITIDLENLDPNPEDVLDLLKDSQCNVWIWTKLAGEYWRRGYLDAAEHISRTAIEAFQANDTVSSLTPIYYLLANIQIAHARSAPKVVLEDARHDNLKGVKLKEEYYREAAQLLNIGERVSVESGEGVGGPLSFLTRGIQQLATRSLDDALKSFDGVLIEKPTNLVALLGKARILYARRNYREALRIFQQVLMYNPRCIPDPRIGIGLCYWVLDQKSKATAAWQRSLEVNSSLWQSQLLLGLEAINASKSKTQGEIERTNLLLQGTRSVEKAFNCHQKSAAAANALCEMFLKKGQYQKALKLAERTIQFADTLTILTEGYVRAGRSLHAEGALPVASKYYSSAIESHPKHVLAAVGLAQMHLQNEEIAAAIHTLDTLLRPPNAQRSLEATVMLASLRAFPRPGVSSSDVAHERAKARDLFDRILRDVELESVNAAMSKSAGRTIEDMHMHVEIARLWQTESLDKTAKALKEARRITEASTEVDPRLLNNLGVLQHLDLHLGEAKSLYEDALTKSSSGLDAKDTMSTTILYNLARVYEDQGEETLAKDAYDKLISRHKEYIDAKIRLAHLLSTLNRHNDAHELLKQCLTSQSSNLNLRAYYTYFLIQANLSKPAKDFVFSTLKDYDKYDVYSLCAAGWIQYHQARESRDTTPKGLEERKRSFQRAAEFYEKALQLDSKCAFAAQGLAIITAEDALGSLGGAIPVQTGVDEAQRRLKNSRDALDIFFKVRESTDDGSVYFNIGHCYYARDEFDRAIESYETALTRYNDGQNISILLCLCRSWYSKATKDQSHVAMDTAIHYAQKAFYIQPYDKAITYNIAMIQQKSLEMIFGINSSKRLLSDLERAIDQAVHAQKLFSSMASDGASLLPYNRDIADQRRKYGDNLLRKSDEHLAAQRNFEAETQAKQNAARRQRQAEKERQEELKRVRLEEQQKEEEALAAERRRAREEAMEWSREVKLESDEERERKSRKSRKAREGGSGDEGEPRKKRRGKLKKAASEEREQAIVSDEEDDEKPRKRAPKKRVIREDDEEEQSGPRRKQFKSREVLSDTDDDMP